MFFTSLIISLIPLLVVLFIARWILINPIIEKLESIDAKLEKIGDEYQGGVYDKIKDIHEEVKRYIRQAPLR